MYDMKGVFYFPLLTLCFVFIQFLEPRSEPSLLELRLEETSSRLLLLLLLLLLWSLRCCASISYPLVEGT